MVTFIFKRNDGCLGTFWLSSYEDSLKPLYHIHLSVIVVIAGVVLVVVVEPVEGHR